MGYTNHGHSKKARHSGGAFVGQRDHRMTWTELEKLAGIPTPDELRDKRLAEAREKKRLENTKDTITMTVSLYRSCASGVRDIVVQTNAQSLDVFIDALADALDTALSNDPTSRSATIAATLRNAFPVAFAIAGYKADKVTESKLLTCGFASPDAAELVAQSKL